MCLFVLGLLVHACLYKAIGPVFWRPRQGILSSRSIWSTEWDCWEWAPSESSYLVHRPGKTKTEELLPCWWRLSRGGLWAEHPHPYAWPLTFLTEVRKPSKIIVSAEWTLVVNFCATVCSWEVRRRDRCYCVSLGRKFSNSVSRKESCSVKSHILSLSSFSGCIQCTRVLLCMEVWVCACVMSMSVHVEAWCWHQVFLNHLPPPPAPTLLFEAGRLSDWAQRSHIQLD